jgi:hypothetical protein
MTLDLIQLAFYAAFTLLGWWLSRRGLLPASVLPTNSAAGAPNLDQQMLMAILRAILNQMPPQQSAGTAPGSSLIHVPIEVSANPRAPVTTNPT